MLNYHLKNLKKILNPSDGEQILIERDNDMLETVIVGGQICNKGPGLTALITLTIHDTYTGDTVFLYKNIKIEDSDYLTIGRIVLDKNKVIKASVASINEEPENDVDIDITLNYFNIRDFSNGFIKVSFLPAFILNQVPIKPIPIIPKWRIKDTDVWYNENEYVEIAKGEYQIEFLENGGYTTPADISIVVYMGRVTEVYATYEILDAVVVFTTDQIDLVDDFGWKLVGWDEYYQQGQYIIIPPGEQEIEFVKNIPGFVDQPNMIETFEEKTLYHFVVNYKRHSGTLKVTLDPAYLQLGKVHRCDFYWFVEYPDGSSSKWLLSDQEIDLAPHEEDYILKIPNIICPKDITFEVEENNIPFKILEHNQKIEMTINMEQV